MLAPSSSSSGADMPAILPARVRLGLHRRLARSDCRARPLIALRVPLAAARLGVPPLHRRPASLNAMGSHRFDAGVYGRRIAAATAATAEAGLAGLVITPGYDL